MSHSHSAQSSTTWHHARIRCTGCLPWKLLRNPWINLVVSVKSWHVQLGESSMEARYLKKRQGKGFLMIFVPGTSLKHRNSQPRPCLHWSSWGLGCWDLKHRQPRQPRQPPRPGLLSETSHWRHLHLGEVYRGKLRSTADFLRHFEPLTAAVLSSQCMSHSLLCWAFNSTPAKSWWEPRLTTLAGWVTSPSTPTRQTVSPSHKPLLPRHLTNYRIEGCKKHCCSHRALNTRSTVDIHMDWDDWDDWNDLNAWSGPKMSMAGPGFARQILNQPSACETSCLGRHWATIGRRGMYWAAIARHLSTSECNSLELVGLNSKSSLLTGHCPLFDTMIYIYIYIYIYKHIYIYINIYIYIYQYIYISMILRAFNIYTFTMSFRMLHSWKSSPCSARNWSRVCEVCEQGRQLARRQRETTARSSD